MHLYGTYSKEELIKEARLNAIIGGLQRVMPMIGKLNNPTTREALLHTNKIQPYINSPAAAIANDLSKSVTGMPNIGMSPRVLATKVITNPNSSRRGFLKDMLQTMYHPEVRQATVTGAKRVTNGAHWLAEQAAH